MYLLGVVVKVVYRRIFSRLLPTLGRSYAVALRFARRDQLATRFAPVGLGPCWAYEKIPAQ